MSRSYEPLSAIFGDRNRTLWERWKAANSDYKAAVVMYGAESKEATEAKDEQQRAWSALNIQRRSNAV